MSGLWQRLQALAGRAYEALWEPPPWAHSSTPCGLVIPGHQAGLNPAISPTSLPRCLQDCPHGREERQGEDLRGEAVLKEHFFGAEVLGPSLTSATYRVTLGELSSSVVRIIFTSELS